MAFPSRGTGWGGLADGARARWRAMLASGTALSIAGILALATLVPIAAADEDRSECRGPFGFFCNPDWPVAGQNIANTRNNPFEFEINASNVGRLTDTHPGWTFPTRGDVSATPTVDDGKVYFPDWGGYLYAVDARTGKQIWSHKISDYNGVPNTFSRSSPVVVGNLLILGDHPPNQFPPPGFGQSSGKGAHMLAVRADTGELVWITQVDNFFDSQITGSPVAFDNKVYIGVSSGEELLVGPNYTCCSFVGSEVALDAHNGKIVWKTYDMPLNSGYTGGAIWESTAAVDPPRGNLYVATGNNYLVPQSVIDCQNKGGKGCVSPDDHFDSIMALDLRTGAIKWATGSRSFDEWTLACFGTPPPQPSVNCPVPSSPDADFGSGPNLFGAGDRQLVGAGTKAGVYWALDPETGKVVWANQVGPGGTFGGIQWGSSTANGHVYVAEANSGHLGDDGTTKVPFTLTRPAPGSARQTNGGFWASLDARTGNVDWETADPAGPTFGDIGATSVANGVVYAGSMDPAGHVFGVDARTGQIKWSFATGGAIGSGASIVNGTVYWGSGYSQFGTSNKLLFALRLPDRD
ncbi:MAG: PQQ-binding-like beta-propeller repeat protein [Chloroflexi bacterium]|nr:PQQ-binding-like beta-propeller repeat protein [Chloroflexota bacterium]